MSCTKNVWIFEWQSYYSSLCKLDCHKTPCMPGMQGRRVATPGPPPSGSGHDTGSRVLVVPLVAATIWPSFSWHTWFISLKEPLLAWQFVKTSVGVGVLAHNDRGKEKNEKKTTTMTVSWCLPFPMSYQYFFLCLILEADLPTSSRVHFPLIFVSASN